MSPVKGSSGEEVFYNLAPGQAGPLEVLPSLLTASLRTQLLPVRSFSMNWDRQMINENKNKQRNDQDLNFRLRLGATETEGNRRRLTLGRSRPEVI